MAPLPGMELVPDTQQLAKYSPTSTPVLDVLRLPAARRRDHIGADDYFFLSSTVILTLIALPWLSRTVALVSSVFSIQRLEAIAVTVLVIPAMALAAAVATHEAGHISVAWLAGFRLASANTSATGRELYSCLGFRLGIFNLEPRKTNHLSRRLLYVVVGGPAVSLLLPLALELSALLGRPQFLFAFAIHVFSVMSALLGVAELLPDAGKGSLSDGARILMLLKNDAAGQRWISTLQLQLALLRGEHPRTWDEGTVTAAASIQDDSCDAVTARWLGYLWALERQDITSATKYLEEALAAPSSAAARLRDRLFLEAAVFQAWFREDSTKAIFWAKRIQQSKLLPLQQLRLKIALLWSEGKLFDAWEKLGDYFYMLRDLPSSPARDLVEQSATEWKGQMASRMLIRAWRTMSGMSQQVEQSTLQSTL